LSFFQFPTNEDLTIEIKISYKEISTGFKVVEKTEYKAVGGFNKRFTVEFENPLWPVGFENFKTVTAEGSVSRFLLNIIFYCNVIYTFSSFHSVLREKLC